MNKKCFALRMEWANITKELDTCGPKTRQDLRLRQVNPLMPIRYNCTYVLFLWSICCKKIILTRKFTKHTIMSIAINNISIANGTIKGQLKVKLADFYFCALGTDGLKTWWSSLYGPEVGNFAIFEFFQ